MSYVQAAAFGTVYATSYAAFIFRAELKSGETVLVHAAAGGVGIAAVQIAKALGAKVIGTAGSDAKVKIAIQNGADHAINYSKEDFVEKVKELTNGKGVDVVYDPVGGDILTKSLRCMAWSGRLLVVGFASGKIPDIKANYLLIKNISIQGLYWGAYKINEPKRYNESIEGSLEMFKQGKLVPVIYKIYRLEELPQALDDLFTRKSYGKVVVTIGEQSKL